MFSVFLQLCCYGVHIPIAVQDRIAKTFIKTVARKDAEVSRCLVQRKKRQMRVQGISG